MFYVQMLFYQCAFFYLSGIHNETTKGEGEGARELLKSQNLPMLHVMKNKHTWVKRTAHDCDFLLNHTLSRR